MQLQEKYAEIITFSSNLIPRSLATVAHVDSIKEECEGGGVKPEFSVFDVGGSRPGEGASFESLCQNPKSAAIPIEYLEETAAFVGKGEDGTAFRVFAELIGDGVMEAVEAAAHVARLYGDENFEAT
jgi:hypothetical protein